MPETFTVRDELACGEDTFWERIHLHPDWNRRFYVDVLQFPAWRLVEQTDDGTSIRRRVRIDPPVVGLPGPVKRAVGERFSYEEAGTYHRPTKRYTFAITPAVMPERTRLGGEAWTERIDDERIVRHVRIDVAVDLRVIGRLVEKLVLRDLRTSFAKAADFTRVCIEELAGGALPTPSSTGG